MSLTIEDAILVAVARDGALSAVEQYGYTPAQIAFAIRQLLKEERLSRNGAKFVLGPDVTLPQINKTRKQKPEPLMEFAVEKLDENAQYVIGHQTFTQIKERVRNQR
jgi:hypothetical protein